ncbi:MAG: hypothetical protein R6V35_04760 [Candidatus Nanohaloarchaea archaeon]
MEGKIVAAVFTTLAVVFAGVSGGSSVNTEVDEVLPEEDSPLNKISSSFGIMDSLFALPEPEHEAVIEVRLDETTEINLNADRLEVEGLRELKGGTGINSQSDIGLREFDGNILMGDPTEIMGSATGFYTENMNVSTTVPLNQEVNTSSVQAYNVSNNAYTLSATEVDIEAVGNETTISRSNTELEITAFEGDIEFRPENLTMIFEGEVAEANAGSASFGGN